MKTDSAVALAGVGRVECVLLGVGAQLRCLCACDRSVVVVSVAADVMT